jgi:hypothetical protein
MVGKKNNGIHFPLNRFPRFVIICKKAELSVVQKDSIPKIIKKE